MSNILNVFSNTLEEYYICTIKQTRYCKKFEFNHNIKTLEN